MNLTLALGLKYESLQKTEFLPSRQEGFSDALKQSTTTNTMGLENNPIIDVKPVEIDTPPTTQASKQHYNYLSYNMHATLNILHAIGTRLHISI